MSNALVNFFNSENFMPHGHCFLWQPEILWLHVISDLGVAVAYYSIPVALVYFARERKDLPYKAIFWLFGAFILLCGTTHLVGIWTIWYPNYAFSGIIKAMTAIASLGTFYATMVLIPKALQLAGPGQLKILNDELRQNIVKRDSAQKELEHAYDVVERQVRERTAALTAINENLQTEIRERKISEQQLSRAFEELTRSNTELQRFAYICSHDLQEPARMVASFAKLLNQRLPPENVDENTRKYLHFLSDGAERMQIMIKSILSYSRLESEERRVAQIDCNALVQGVLSDLQPVIVERQAKVTCHPLPTICGDPIQLAQVFQNLISNGLKFFRKDQRPEIEIGAQRREGDWQFIVRDNGIGIDARYFEKIFVIFQRLNRKEDYPGTGIGLAICKKIVERHGGKMSLESSEGKGTTFYFTIPDQKADDV
jgi:signal transduction histidine kinase